jgi:hypothetical protein
MFKKEYRLLLVVLGSIFLATGSYAQQKAKWEIQPNSIVTRWANQVNPSNVLPEYPRPQMVRGGNWKNLNGVWEYAITDKKSSVPSKFDGQILVPYPLESALSGVKKSLQPTENLWYKRNFTVDTKKGQRTVLHFGAVDWQATVYVNGKEIGSHVGGYTAFSFDITDVVKRGTNNIVVKVYDPTDQGIGPHGKQVLKPGSIYYTPSSGIWQTVWLESVPTDYIKQVNITSDIDNGLVRTTIEAPTDCDVELTASLSGKVVSTITGRAGSIPHLLINNAMLWSPESPVLYDLHVKLLRKGVVIDEVKSYFGMRKISIAKDDKGVDRIFLNNHYYYNLGTLDQGFWPDGLYTAPTDSALQFDIRAIKAMGFNTIRKHIKVEPARWYYYTDKIGMLVWQDMVNPNQGLPVGSKEEFERESAEILHQLHHFPSITTWVLFNEKWGQYDQERLTNWIKQTDPSRLVNGHSGEYLYVNNELRSPSPNAYVSADMTDVHSYPFPRQSIKFPGKVQVCGEFGGIGVPIEGHLWDDLVAGWGYDGVVSPSTMKRQYSQMIDSLRLLERNGLSASIYTQPFDVESEQNGLITYDRQLIKLPADTLYAINSQLLSPDNRSVAVSSSVQINIAPSEPPSLQTRLEAFRSGSIDSLGLRSLAMLLDNKKDTILAKEVVSYYLNHIKNPSADDNLKLLRKFTYSTSDKTFPVLLHARKVALPVERRSEIDSKITFLIEKNEIIPVLKTGSALEWDEIEKRLVAKYAELGEEITWQSQFLHAINQRNWDLFKLHTLTWFNEYGKNRSWITTNMINTMSWIIFSECSDEEVLRIALTMMEGCVNANPSAEEIDTYANLLYKTGKVKDAILWQEKAVSLKPSIKELSINLNKMKSGDRTWPEKADVPH